MTDIPQAQPAVPQREELPGTSHSLHGDTETLRLLVASVRDYAIFLLDPRGYIRTWNLGAERIKGYTAPEIIGKHFSIFYTREAVERGHPDWELKVAAEDGRYEEEGWRCRKDGTQFWANVVITALRDENGVLRGFGKVTRDLTERKRAEDDLRRANEQLEERVAQRTEELGAANEALQATNEELAAQREGLAEADQRKDEFLAMLGHELRNPLSPALTALHVLKERPPEDPAFARSLDVADRQLHNMARIVDDLLDVSRISRGKIELRKASVDLKGVVSRTAEALRHLMETRQHELLCSLPEKPVYVDADRTRMDQILTNLLTNAAKYTDPGGKIWLSLERDGIDAVIRVRDSGIGIPRSLLPHLFDLFVQSERSLDRAQGGLGIGLTLVKRLVEMHGGTVAATSEGPNRGSEFTVRLPALERAPRREARHPHPQPVGPQRSYRILVVDDNRDAAETLAELLEDLGHAVACAYDGLAAIEKAREELPLDAILLDIGLPLLNGYQVAQQLREDPRFRETVFIALTGYSTPDAQRRSQEAGFDHHLVKPVELEALLGLVGSLRNEVRSGAS